MGTMFASDAEVALHEAVIDSLAAEMHRPAEEIKQHYLREIERLQEGARVRDFISVCAVRHLRQTLRTSAG